MAGSCQVSLAILVDALLTAHPLEVLHPCVGPLRHPTCVWVHTKLGEELILSISIKYHCLSLVNFHLPQLHWGTFCCVSQQKETSRSSSDTCKRIYWSLPIVMSSHCDVFCNYSLILVDICWLTRRCPVRWWSPLPLFSCSGSVMSAQALDPCWFSPTEIFTFLQLSREIK